MDFFDTLWFDDNTWHKITAILLANTFALLFFFLIRFILRYIVYNILLKIIRKTKTTWDDIFFEKNTFNRISYLIPGLILLFAIPNFSEYFFEFHDVAVLISKLYVVLIVGLTIDSILNAANTIYESYEISKDRPIKGYIQLVKIIVYFIAFIVALSVLFNKSVIYFFSGLGALAAVLLLVFKDSIMGFVAALQLSSNKMLRVGDWITIPGKNADGDVIEVSLHTVKIQNFDKTITTVPTYSLVSDSFQNWRGMQEAGGRRIKRSINIDFRTIKILSSDDVERLKNIRLLKPYIESRQKEIEEYHKNNNIASAHQINGRVLTNIGTFRNYIYLYLKSNPNINSNLTLLVRQLHPNSEGIPIEIYTFTKTTNWAEYETIQADLFDHILAIIHEFDLAVFQLPSGHDLATFINNK